MPNLRTCMAIAALLVLPACEGENGSGGLTEEESRQLDEAEAMLDEGTAPPQSESE